MVDRATTKKALDVAEAYLARAEEASEKHGWKGVEGGAAVERIWQQTQHNFQSYGIFLKEFTEHLCSNDRDRLQDHARTKVEQEELHGSQQK